MDEINGNFPKEMFIAGVGLDGRIYLKPPSKDVKNLDRCNGIVDALLAKENGQNACDTGAELELFRLLTGVHSVYFGDDAPPGGAEEFAPFVRLIFESWAQQSQNTYAIAYRLGMANAIEWRTHVNVSRAANGRRKIGSASMAKVQKAASGFKHLSNGDASFEMAEIVNLDPGTIRRYLTKLFPGDNWKQ